MQSGVNVESICGDDVSKRAATLANDDHYQLNRNKSTGRERTNETLRSTFLRTSSSQNIKVTHGVNRLLSPFQKLSTEGGIGSYNRSKLRYGDLTPLKQKAETKVVRSDFIIQTAAAERERLRKVIFQSKQLNKRDFDPQYNDPEFTKSPSEKKNSQSTEIQQFRAITSHSNQKGNSYRDYKRDDETLEQKSNHRVMMSNQRLSEPEHIYGDLSDRHARIEKMNELLLEKQMEQNNLIKRVSSLQKQIYDNKTVLSQLDKNHEILFKAVSNINHELYRKNEESIIRIKELQMARNHVADGQSLNLRTTAQNREIMHYLDHEKYLIQQLKREITDNKKTFLYLQKDRDLIQNDLVNKCQQMTGMEHQMLVMHDNQNKFMDAVERNSSKVDTHFNQSMHLTTQSKVEF